ncbi:peptide chain release factor 2 [Oceanirhabdus sp. W0125-5]|uniref:peptide chain release factor 2 n=1 Tax=Oceanirhabdus sp. W0125-5 TaxID=2999116 RepID=UPI0022F2F09D|nr:peptide chain release factor 2 [Oceanirhabdus sp. W0125-5]WBW98510.1 peptide chain release factor 2 [Oceanirhabdus sp. W0125-5]
MVIKLEEMLNETIAMSKSIDEVRVSLDIAKLELRVKELEGAMQEPDFWNDAQAASEITMEAKGVKDRIDKFKDLELAHEELIMLIEMSIEENDESSLSEIKSEFKRLDAIVEGFKVEILLSGEYDKNNAILSLHTGAGGNDAQDWTEMLYRMYSRWCESHNYKIEVLDYVPDTEAGIKAVTIKVTGAYAYGYLKAEKGVHRLVRISPYNSNGKRQTSFASCEVLPELTKDQDIDINSDDLKIDTYRAGGAGGQHVNKTESAIRITHIPTGLVVQCQNERSQHTNKDVAMRMLKAKLVELKERAHKEKIEDLTGELKDIGWGSQIRSYVFHPYNLVKDHRTGVETANINGVMDGDIDEFINALLRGQKK